MIETLLAANYGNSVTTWANTLVTRIKVSTFFVSYRDLG